MTPIRLEGDDDEEGDGGGDDDEEEEDDDDESTPVPRSKRRTAACVSMLAFRSFNTTYPTFSVRNGSKSRPHQQEEDGQDDDDEASEPADSILGSESEGEETSEVDGLLDDE
jgi:hypothetical protein